jgi:protein SCO1/2
MKTPRSIHALLALTLVASACVKSNTSSASSASSTTAATRRSTRGTIRSFGPNRAFANIAHEDIPGYMQAMTMPFEFRDASLSAGLSVNDRVRFAFEEGADGQLVIVSISRE